MGGTSSKKAAPGYSYAGLMFGQVFGARAYMKPLEYASPRPLKSLNGRTYVVTGGSSGIGLACVEFLYTQGALVHVLCRDEARGEAAAAKIKEQRDEAENQWHTGGEIVVHRVDCSRPAQLKAFSEEVFEGPNAACHGLVNNAGALTTRRTIVDGVESHVACHVIGLHALTKYLRPALTRASNEGLGCPPHVVNVASAGLYTAALDVEALRDGFEGLEKSDGSFDGALVYAVCKRAQLELTRHWAKALSESGIKVSCMHPGWVKTNGLDGLFELHPSYKSWVAGFRTPADGADTINWLLMSDDKVDTGRFWFDREEAKEHQFLAGTQSSESEQQALWQFVEGCVSGEA